MGVIKPIKLLLISIFIWIIFYLLIEVEYMYDGSILFPAITLLGYISAFILGLYSLKSSHIKPQKLTSDSKLKQIVGFLFIIGLFGVLLKLYSGFFNSGIFLADNVFEKRLENMGKELSGGAAGVIGSIFFPFSFISLLLVVYNYKIFNRLYILLIFMVGIYPFLETIFMGGRTTIALLGSTLIFTAYASFSKNSNIKLTKFVLFKNVLFSVPQFLMQKKVIIPLVIIAVIFVSYSVNVVNKRLDRFGYEDRTFKIWEQKNYQWVKFDNDLKKKYFKSSDEEKAKILGYHNLNHYFVHGVFEYVRLVNHLDKTSGYYYGMYEFNVFFKFFKALGLPVPSHNELNEILDRKNIYQTFWGPFYIDFGFWGIALMFLWGRYVKRVYLHAKMRQSQYVIFYAYLSTIVVTSVYINFLLGSASYYLFAFLVTLLLFKLWPNNLTIVMKE